MGIKEEKIMSWVLATSVIIPNTDSLVQDCSNSIANALE